MDNSRRNFLKLAGLSAVGLAGAQPLIGSMAEAKFDQYVPNAEALKGTHWAMVVDISKCRPDCDDCIRACHINHNVPHYSDPKHEVKWIWKEGFENAFPGEGYEHLTEKFEKTPFMVLCNHCDNPPCVRVCPTQATFKRASDGLVLMDFHRCIGCRFCMAACPYGSRSFNWFDPRRHLDYSTSEYPTRTKGVVEKCNFCAERLAVGQIPFCVEACQTGALVFGDLGDPHSEVREILHTRYTIRRKAHLGTGPNIFYVV